MNFLNKTKGDRRVAGKKTKSSKSTSKRSGKRGIKQIKSAGKRSGGKASGS
jgi:hypothetical protein